MTAPDVPNGRNALPSMNSSASNLRGPHESNTRCASFGSSEHELEFQARATVRAGGAHMNALTKVEAHVRQLHA
jgi:hypothetical protein